VAALAATAFSDPHAGFTWREGAAMLLTLPVLVPALPVLYVGGAAAWNATGADSGGPMWPVTLVYSVIFAMIAGANVWLVAMVLGRRRRASASP
jgi:membrane protein implicated in regulation of membrane protease activity